MTDGNDWYVRMNDRVKGMVDDYDVPIIREMFDWIPVDGYYDALDSTVRMLGGMSGDSRIVIDDYQDGMLWRFIRSEGARERGLYDHDWWVTGNDDYGGVRPCVILFMALSCACIIRALAESLRVVNCHGDPLVQLIRVDNRWNGSGGDDVTSDVRIGSDDDWFEWGLFPDPYVELESIQFNVAFRFRSTGKYGYKDVSWSDMVDMGVIGRYLEVRGSGDNTKVRLARINELTCRILLDLVELGSWDLVSVLRFIDSRMRFIVTGVMLGMLNYRVIVPNTYDNAFEQICFNDVVERGMRTLTLTRLFNVLFTVILNYDSCDGCVDHGDCDDCRDDNVDGDGALGVDYFDDVGDDGSLRLHHYRLSVNWSGVGRLYEDGDWAGSLNRESILSRNMAVTDEWVWVGDKQIPLLNVRNGDNGLYGFVDEWATRMARPGSAGPVNGEGIDRSNPGIIPLPVLAILARMIHQSDVESLYWEIESFGAIIDSDNVSYCSSSSMTVGYWVTVKHLAGLLRPGARGLINDSYIDRIEDVAGLVHGYGYGLKSVDAPLNDMIYVYHRNQRRREGSVWDENEPWMNAVVNRCNLSREVNVLDAIVILIEYLLITDPALMLVISPYASIFMRGFLETEHMIVNGLKDSGDDAQAAVHQKIVDDAMRACDDVMCRFTVRFMCLMLNASDEDLSVPFDYVLESMKMDVALEYDEMVKLVVPPVHVLMLLEADHPDLFDEHLKGLLE